MVLYEKMNIICSKTEIGYIRINYNRATIQYGTPIMNTFRNLLIASIFCVSIAVGQVANHIVISEVYGGGGNSGSTWKNDFVELYNPTDSIVSVAGWSVQYGSATGTSWQVTNLSGSIAPHGFFLVQEAAGAGGTQSLPTPDVAGSISMAGTAGKIALCNTTIALSGTSSTGPTIVDFVGYGGANGYEGSGATPAPSNSASVERKALASSTADSLKAGGLHVALGNGYDSNNNSTDFVAQNPIVPQNSASATEPLIPDVTPPSVVSLKVLSGTQLELLFNEPVDSLSSSTALNYSIDKSISVAYARRDTVNIKKVLISTSLMANDFYTLTIQSIKDTIGNEMTTPATFMYTVGVLTIAQARSAGAGVAIRVRGIVTVANEFKSPSFIQDTTAGIAVYGTNFSSSAHAGELWEVAGVLKDFNGLLEVDPITDTIRMSSGNALPAPKVITSAEMNESLEGQLVRINNVKFIATGNFGAVDSTYASGDPNGVMTVRADKDSNIPGSPIPTDSVNIVGVLSDYKGAYQLQPRSINDIGIIDPPPEQTWMDIFAARGLPDSTVVKVRGIVTFVQPASSSAPTAHTVYFQDRTGGLALYDVKTDTLQVGDSIEVKGKILNFNNLQEIKLIDSLTLFARGLVLPDAKEIGVTQAAEVYESQIIKVLGVQFVETGTFTGGTSGTTYHITNGSAQLDVRVPYGTALEGSAIPVGAINLIGLLGQYNTNYQVMPRSTADIEQLPGPGFSSLPTVTALSDTSFTVSWTTIATAHSWAAFGTSPLLDDSVASSVSADVTLHAVTVSGRTPGRLYYFRAVSENGEGRSNSAIYPVVTTSTLSTGQMNVYFNYSVDGTLGLSPAANGNTDLKSKLLERISQATKTIDLALYSFDDFSGSITVVADDVADSLIAAKNRGVAVRMVFDNKQTSAPLAKIIGAGISVQKRNLAGNNGIMHNKFVIIDGRDTTSATDDWVMSGSWNVTNIGTYEDAQNAVFIQDQSLARIYTIEFEEMFGSTTETANPTLARFGPTKSNNTPHFTYIQGKKVEIYFSPSDHTTSQIIQALSTANSNIFFGLLAFTRDDIRETLIGRKNAGVIVRGMIDQEPSELSTLQSAGVDALSAGHSVVTGLFHHKYGIIDPFGDASDPMVITGSHNWSTAAEVDNDENTLIIHSGDIARQYVQEFSKRYTESGGTGSITDVEDQRTVIPRTYELTQNYPNPFNPRTTFEYQIPATGLVSVKIYDVLGRETATLVNEIKPAGRYTISWDASQTASGVYFNVFRCNGKQIVRKMTVLK